MNEERSDELSEDKAIEQDILSHRKFTLAEAIGRMGGDDLLKGTSPVPAKKQADYVIVHFLEKRLRDSEGALLPVLARYARESDILLKGYEQPFEALADVVESILASENRLRRFVGRVDSEWGRMYSERPYREIEGRDPHPDDPYTVESVRKQLEDLLTVVGEQA